MKVWLNDLKEGDEFYWPNTILGNVLKCEHLGDAHNMNFRMPRIKYKILEGCNDNVKKILDVNELFVNTYVYTDYDSAYEVLIDKLKEQLKNTKDSIIEHKRRILLCEEHAEYLEKIINNYERKNNKEN